MLHPTIGDVSLNPLARYRRSDFARIGVAIGVPAAEVERHEKVFDDARIFVQFQGDALPYPPYQIREELLVVAANARRLREHLDHIPAAQNARQIPKERVRRALRTLKSLLHKLGIEHWDHAIDGPDPDKLDALSHAEGAHHDKVVALVEKVAELAPFLEGLLVARLPQAGVAALSEIINAVEALERMAGDAADRVLRIGNLVVPKGHAGDWGVMGWIEDMARLYKKLTGRRPTATVTGNKPGPFIRMLMAAGRPIGLIFTVWAWRSRVRAHLKRFSRPAPAK